jgi:hypothetical protein
MSGVENRFLEATIDQENLGRGAAWDERSLILEEKLDEILNALFDDLALGLRTMRAYAERRIEEIEGSRDALMDDAHSADSILEPDPVLDDPDATGAPESFFRQERATYEERAAELARYEGRYVVIKGREIAGVWPSYEEALDGGYDRFGPVTFFVKQIVAS